MSNLRTTPFFSPRPRSQPWDSTAFESAIDLDETPIVSRHAQPFEPEPEWPNDRPARVTWTLDDGTKLTEEVLSARGGPDLPFAPDEIRAKIHGIVSQPYPAMAPALDRLMALEGAALERSWAETVGAMTR